jgi:flagella basal body P-ring formation protein FlgA
MSFIFCFLSFVLLTGGKLEQEIASVLKNTFTFCKSVEVQLTQQLGEYDLITLSSSKNISVKNNIALVPVVLSNNGKITEKYLSAKIKLFYDVYICIRDVERNIPLQQSDFRIETLDIASMHKKPLDTSEKVDLFQSKDKLRPGEILFTEDLKNVSVIKNGDRVTAEYNINGLSISFEAVSRQDGAPGDIVLIIASDKKQFKAKVINNSTVEVME